MKPKTDIIELFDDARCSETYVRIAAPMVRYSKLEFRTLLRSNNVDLCFTPMIIADSFCRSNLARQNEFTTNFGDTPLVVQFAARDTIELLTASEMIYPYADGVDLNCGCPQRWAIASGYGCAMLKQPELLSDMVATLKRNLPGSFTISVKMRLLQKDDLNTSIDLCRIIERCGASFITVHGRTPWEKTCEPVDVAAVAQIVQSLQIPVVANGDIKCIDDAKYTYSQTNCAGIMAARGLLANPTMFTGTSITPLSCIEDWISLAQQAGDHINFQCFHHHLTFMAEKLLKRRQRVTFNNLTTKQAAIEYLQQHLHIRVADHELIPRTILDEYTDCIYDDSNYLSASNNVEDTISEASNRNGKFFTDHIAKLQPTTPKLDANCDDEFCSISGISLFQE